MDTFEFIERVNKIFGRNHFSGTPEQQKINVEVAKLLKEYDQCKKTN